MLETYHCSSSEVVTPVIMELKCGAVNFQHLHSAAVAFSHSSALLVNIDYQIVNLETWMSLGRQSAALITVIMGTNNRGFSQNFLIFRKGFFPDFCCSPPPKLITSENFQKDL